MQAGELHSDDIHDAQDAAQVLLELLDERDGGREAAVPAALVALDALPALQSLGAQLPTKAPVQQLLSLCCLAREKVWLHFLTSTLDNACQDDGKLVQAPLPTRYVWRCGIATLHILPCGTAEAPCFPLCSVPSKLQDVRDFMPDWARFVQNSSCEFLCFRYRCRFGSRETAPACLARHQVQYSPSVGLSSCTPAR